jgi:enoyl-CoA hydratase/carnithine racemase
VSLAIPVGAPAAPSVLSTRQGGLAIVSLNRPQRLNAIDIHLLRALDAALADALADDAVRAIVLRGEGRAFCAGDDLMAQLEVGTLDPQEMQAFVDLLQRITVHLMLGDKPVVGLVQGWAIGGGFSWTLNCDLTLWAAGAQAYLPEAAFGLFVSGGASFLLPRTVGRMPAAAMTLLAPKLGADELHRMGIAWRVVPDDELLSQGLALAGQLAQLPPDAARRVKRALLAPDREALQAALRLEAQACLAGARDPQTLARIQAFLGSRA